jgi:hypothetical protein
MAEISAFLRRLRRLSWTDRALLGLAAIVCLCMWAALRVVSLRRLVRWTGGGGSRPATANRPTIDRVAWAVRTAGGHLFPARPCLPQALAARLLLARFGVSTDFRIGVQRAQTDELRAHAWLEHGGEVLIGGAEAPFEYQSLTGPEP